jgi:hypothetical protein
MLWGPCVWAPHHCKWGCDEVVQMSCGFSITENDITEAGWCTTNQYLVFTKDQAQLNLKLIHSQNTYLMLKNRDPLCV